MTLVASAKEYVIPYGTCELNSDGHLAHINEKLWIGHFDITAKNGIPAYRHTVLSLPENETLHHQLEDLVDIAIYECEKYYPAFQLVLFEDTSPIKALSVSTFDIIGRA